MDSGKFLNRSHRKGEDETLKGRIMQIEAKRPTTNFKSRQKETVRVKIDFTKSRIRKFDRLDFQSKRIIQSRIRKIKSKRSED